MNRYLHRGVSLSLLLHGIVLFSIVYVGTLLPELTPPLVIDFSIKNDCADCPSCDCTGKPGTEKPAEPPQQKAPAPPVKKSPVVDKPKPTEKKPQVTKLEKPEVQTVKAETQKPVPQKIAAIQEKKRLAIQEKVAPAPVQPLPESVPAEIAEEIVSPSSAAPTESAPFTVQDTTTRVIAASASAQEIYIKANFSYIRDTVESNINYPNIARKMGWQGKVLIAFTICADGRVEDIRVIKSCGFKALDKSAINTIERSAPFPKPPVRAEITLPITYRLN